MFKQEKKTIDIFLMTKNKEITGFGIDRVESIVYYRRRKALQQEGHILRHRRITPTYLAYVVGLDVALMRPKHA